ncbi:MAG: hypothetical protein M3390_01865 [Chloroflexota bacterium]|nr:hypothetical protein [Chloroflexota bacterium]
MSNMSNMSDEAGRRNYIKALREQVKKKADLPTLVSRLAELDTLLASMDAPAEGEATSRELKEVYSLIDGVFDAMMELTEKDASRGAQLILEYLLPHIESADTLPNTRTLGSYHRDTLTKWLNQYQPGDMAEVRSTVLDRLVADLRSADHWPKSICWTIAKIGFRRQDVANTVLGVCAEYDDETGDVALQTLATLGVPPGKRQVLLRELHQRIVKRYNWPLVSALAQLADPATTDVIGSYLDRLDSVPEGGRLFLWEMTRILSSIADEHYEDSEVQERTWQLVVDLFRVKPEITSIDPHLGSGIAPYCDSARAVKDLFRWLGEDSSIEGAHPLYLLQQRLADCFRPHQLEGWRQVAGEEAAFSYLREMACIDTKQEVLAATSESLYKESAWGTLLRAGHAPALLLFDQAVGRESSRYVSKRICEMLACFRLDPLPPLVRELITEHVEGYSEDRSTNADLVIRMAAIEIARSTATEEAFDVLLNFGLTYRGDVLLDSIDALSDVAAALYKAGDPTVITKLLDTLSPSNETRHRIVAASAFEELARRDELPVDVAARLQPLVLEADRDELERSILVAVLSVSLGLSLHTEVLAALRLWAATNSERLGLHSLEALAYHGYLIEEPDLLVRRLGLRSIPRKSRKVRITQEDRGTMVWDIDPKRSRMEEAGTIIGILYLMHPEQFTQAVASLLRTEDHWGVAVPLMRVLRNGEALLATIGRRFVLKREIVSALVYRARRQQTRVSAEKVAFHTLASLAPEQLVRQSWNRLWYKWLPTARTTLAEALGDAQYTGAAAAEHAWRARALLLLLTRDDQYAVRREAYRSLLRQAPRMLEALCRAWAGAPNTELRFRAAEMYEWLPPPLSGTAAGHPEGNFQLHSGGTFTELWEPLAIDPEPTVRKAAERAQLSRRKRLWAEAYMERVLDAKGGTNEDVLGAWAYGEALVEIGDDATVEALGTLANNFDVPPNVRYWAEKSAKKLEDKWRKVVQKWPEAVRTWEGALELHRGHLLLGGNGRVPVECTLWHEGAVERSGRGQAVWGGTALAEESLPLEVATELGLELENGRRGRMSVSYVNATQGLVVFNGLGAYPREGGRYDLT